MLHGRSGGEDDMWVFARTLPNDWLVVAPRGVAPDPSGGRAWVPRSRDHWPVLAEFDDAVSSVRRFIRSLSDMYGTDLSRLFLMGFSQGAATSYATALRHPDLIGGVAGLVGFLPGEASGVIADRPLAGLPVFMSVGLRDPFIPRRYAQDCARGLRKAGADVEYNEYDVGHKLSRQGFQDLGRWWQGLVKATAGQSRENS
jgi:phospholipase/carboxylesterase